MRIATGEIEEGTPPDDREGPCGRRHGEEGRRSSGEIHDARAKGGDRQGGGGEAVGEAHLTLVPFSPII